jgi:arabinogalactan oligomer/maltooligosaccharide transport system substrate-binding protein
MKRTIKKILSLTLAAVMCLGVFTGCGEKAYSNEELQGTYNITMWVSEKDGVKEQFLSQIEEFNKANPGVVVKATIEGVTEGDAASKVIADVATAPDIYCFAQDQLARLVQASALAAPGKKAQEAITEANDPGSVTATKVAGDIYAYPLTSDNGYYMYYDTSVVSADDVNDLAKIVAACEKANKKFRFALENAWYTASFFFATGCHTTWTTNEKGEFTAVDDTFNSAEGITAMKGMQILTKSPIYDSNADIFTDAAVVVTGTWNSDAAKTHFGANLGAAKLPSFTVDGKTYQLGSYSGFKLMGIKPQQDAKKGAVLQQLAQFLTNEENQMARFNSFGWGPSNKNAQASDAVKADLSLSALAAQNAHGTPQGQIAGVFWDNAKLLGAVAKTAKSDADLQAGLDAYTSALNEFTKLTPEQRAAFTVIGGIKDSGWGADFQMKEDPAGTWTSVEAFDMAVGTEFKVRQGMGWNVAYGSNKDNADTSIPLTDKGNFKVEKAGKYYVQLVLGENGTAVINLVPAN